MKDNNWEGFDTGLEKLHGLTKAAIMANEASATLLAKEHFSIRTEKFLRANEQIHIQSTLLTPTKRMGLVIYKQFGLAKSLRFLNQNFQVIRET